MVATADLPPEGLVAPAHQTLGFVSWIGLLLFADYSLPALGLFLAAHYGLTIVQLGLVDRWDVDSIVRLATVAVGVAGFQIAFGLAGVALRRVARQAAEASTRQAKLLTAEAVAEQVHADREARYGQLRGTAVPLLRDIGEGTLDPSESEVQRRCAVEAARMRRLFAEDSDTEDPFTAELAGLSDVAERKGTVVRQSVVGSWLSPPPPVRMILLDEVARVLLAADTARITLSGTGEDVTVSVVADGICRPAEIRRRADVLITTVTEHDRVWVEAQWTKLLSPAS
ncbi:MAG: hypothetical protein ACRDTE_23885 [Pseudonocardiaceae bacterium]